MKLIPVLAGALALITVAADASDVAPAAHVAFVVSDGFNVMDFAGPWEVFTSSSALRDRADTVILLAERAGVVDHEAAVLAGLYRDVSGFPEPVRTTLQNDLRTSTRAVIDGGWPLQRRGNRWRCLRAPPRWPATAQSRLRLFDKSQGAASPA